MSAQNLYQFGFSPDLPALLKRYAGERFCTSQFNPAQRREWLTEVIGKQYANVKVTASKQMPLFNDMVIYPWNHGIRLSPIRSNAITLERLAAEPTQPWQDCYFIVLLTSGDYQLEQTGRSVILRPGDMAFYDATKPHNVTSSTAFSKLLISVPRYLIDERIRSAEQLTAQKLSPLTGMKNYLSYLTQSLLPTMMTTSIDQYRQKADIWSDLFIESLANLSSNDNDKRDPARTRMFKIQGYIQRQLHDEQLTPYQIAMNTGISLRYLNKLFHQHNTSPMRYIMQQRFERAKYLLGQPQLSVTDVALHAGIKNLSYFSKKFKAIYGCSPRYYRYQRAEQAKRHA